jgi:hypothetical protein
VDSSHWVPSLASSNWSLSAMVCCWSPVGLKAWGKKTAGLQGLFCIKQNLILSPWKCDLGSLSSYRSRSDLELPVSGAASQALSSLLAVCWSHSSHEGSVGALSLLVLKGSCLPRAPEGAAPCFSEVQNSSVPHRLCQF